MELGNALRTGNSQYPTKTALIVEERIWTYADLDMATDRMAAGLLALGIKPGDRVAVHFTNGFEIVVAYYACFKAGAIVVPLNTRMRGPELQYVLNHSAARFYLGQPGLFAEIAPVRGGGGELLGGVAEEELQLSGVLLPMAGTRRGAARPVPARR